MRISLGSVRLEESTKSGLTDNLYGTHGCALIHRKTNGIAIFTPQTHAFRFGKSRTDGQFTSACRPLQLLERNLVHIFCVQSGICLCIQDGSKNIDVEGTNL